MSGKQHWLLVMDDCTYYCWSYFLKEKIDLKSHVIEPIKELYTKYNCKVKYICCDNAGENISLEKVCSQEGLGVFLSIQLLELLSKMEEWNKSLQLFTIKLELC